MRSARSSRFAVLLILLVSSASLIFTARVPAQTAPDPWTAAQTVQPANLLKELDNPKSAPVVLFVGFKRLYTAGHIKGAQYHGTAGTPEGLQELTAWAATLPRD